MTEIKARDVKELRDMTGAGMMEAKQALTEAGGDIEKAKTLLSKRGAEIASKKSDRLAAEGVIVSYLHGKKLGVLVELNCETDFVAKNEEFVALAHEIALQVAGLNPEYIDRNEVPADKISELKSEWAGDVAGKPEEVANKIIEGKLEKFYAQTCLLDQPYFREEAKTVRDLVNELVGKIKENIFVGRIVRLQMGQNVHFAEKQS